MHRGTVDDVRAALARPSHDPDPDVRDEEDSARAYLLVRLGRLPRDTASVVVRAHGQLAPVYEVHLEVRAYPRVRE